MKILITGASGFIGGQLFSSLVNLYGNDSVVAFTSKEIPNVNCIIYNNLKNFRLGHYDFSTFTHLIHAGAFTPKNNNQSDDIEKCNENIYFTENILNLGFENLNRIIYLSTLDVYRGQGAISEQSEIKPISLYGLSKFYCEEIIKKFSQQKNIEYMNLRIGHVYGPGEDGYQKILPLTISKILTGKPVEIWGDGDELRSYIYIEDVIQSIIKSIDYAPANLDINIVSGRPISIYNLILKIIKISGKNILLNKIASNHVKRDLVFHNSRLIETLLQSETDLDAGLELEYKYMKQKHENSI